MTAIDKVKPLANVLNELSPNNWFYLLCTVFLAHTTFHLVGCIIVIKSKDIGRRPDGFVIANPLRKKRMSAARWFSLSGLVFPIAAGAGAFMEIGWSIWLLLTLIWMLAVSVVVAGFSVLD